MLDYAAPISSGRFQWRRTRRQEARGRDALPEAQAEAACGNEYGASTIPAALRASTLLGRVAHLHQRLRIQALPHLRVVRFPEQQLLLLRERLGRRDGLEEECYSSIQARHAGK